MSPLQVVNQLRTLLAARTWGGAGGADPVFGQVHVTVKGMEEGLKNYRVPCALIQVATSTADPDEPRLVRQLFDVLVVHAVAGDPIGENVLRGANRASATSSAGAGLLEIEKEVKAVAALLGPAAGINLSLVAESDAGALGTAQVRYAAARAYRFAAWCTTFDE